MADPYIKEQLEVLLRIAVRGRNQSLRELNSDMVDYFQHLEDEIDRTIKYLKEKYG